MTQPQYQQPYPGPHQQQPYPPYQNQQPYPQQQYQQPYQQQPYQQQPYQGAPQQGYQQQYHAPQQQAGHQPQQGQVSCRICGNGPAAPATFRAVVGAVIMHTIWTAPGPYCRDCGMHTFRRQTTKTLTGGWCSVGAIILTPFFILMNVSARGKVANLPAPQPRMDGRGQRPLDPGAPVFHRPGAYVYPALVTFLLFLIIIGNLSS
ncbi:hypothetical protein [Actinomadura sp. DC4]|uniref:hypothetical protein n=1 Tax=Actinomadura sp. DC4 TaxID=3055069 RepID=UPI0025AEF682|nr:hypothetical protein [Actinomadura sp. DC4]MDN3352611.1 hypothetical protein [Actinomadura sp. DC4]